MNLIQQKENYQYLSTVIEKNDNIIKNYQYLMSLYVPLSHWFDSLKVINRKVFI